MTQITDGKVSYGRTVNRGDYNSERADATFSFTADENGVLDIAGAVATAHKAVHHLLHQEAPETAVAPVKTPTDKDGLAAAAKAPRKTPAPKASTAEAPAETADEWGGTATEITDQDLLDATQKKQGEIKNSVAIKAVIGHYTPPPAALATIPQEKRGAYLKELGALTKTEV